MNRLIVSLSSHRDLLDSLVLEGTRTRPSHEVHTGEREVNKTEDCHSQLADAFLLKSNIFLNCTQLGCYHSLKSLTNDKHKQQARDLPNMIEWERIILCFPSFTS
ncbi:unnamed protein product [Auanema sp. JU1783]|nr:unnamed protein product [Auanema sp. JU1783]